MTLLRTEPEAATEADVEPEELVEAPDEPGIDDTETAEVTAESDGAEGALAPSESDGGA
jgi:hypothetical protein